MPSEQSHELNRSSFQQRDLDQLPGGSSQLDCSDQQPGFLHQHDLWNEHPMVRPVLLRRQVVYRVLLRALQGRHVLDPVHSRIGTDALAWR
jgi:hypothetical protein